MFYERFLLNPSQVNQFVLVVERERESPELSLICVLIISKLVIQLSNNLHNNYNKPLAALSLAW